MSHRMKDDEEEEDDDDEDEGEEEEEEEQEFITGRKRKRGVEEEKVDIQSIENLLEGVHTERIEPPMKKNKEKIERTTQVLNFVDGKMDGIDGGAGDSVTFKTCQNIIKSMLTDKAFLKKVNRILPNFTLHDRSIFAFYIPHANVVQIVLTSRNHKNQLLIFVIEPSELENMFNFSIYFDDIFVHLINNLQINDLEKTIKENIMTFRNIRICNHLTMSKYDSALRKHFTTPVGSIFHHPQCPNCRAEVVVQGPSTLETGIVRGIIKSEDEVFIPCPGYVMKGKVSEHCSNLEKSLKKADRWIHLDPSWKYFKKTEIQQLQEKVKDLETRIQQLETENQKLSKSYDILKNRLDYIDNHPLISEVIEAIDNEKFNKISMDFYVEQMKLRNLPNYQSIKWLNYPTVFAYFQEIREFIGKKAYSCILGEVRWTGEGFQGILVGPSEKAIQNLVRSFQYLPGLSPLPLISFLESLKKLNPVYILGTIAGDDLHQNAGFDRRFENKIPVWMGRTLLDSYGILDTVLDLLKFEHFDQHPNDDTQEQQLRRKLYRNIKRFQRKEKQGGLAKKICQLYLNVSGMFENTEKKIVSKSFKFPIFWYAHKGMNKEEISAMLCSSVIYIKHFIQEEYTELSDKIHIDSICWDGDKAVQSFISDFSTSTMIDEDIIHCKIKIPLIQNELFFCNDIGHLLKNIRNNFYNFEEKPKKNQKIRFPVRKKEKHSLIHVPLFKILKRVVDLERDGDLKISRLRNDHIKLSERSKMNQRLSNDIWTRQTLLAIEHFILNYLIQKQKQAKNIIIPASEENTRKLLDDEQQNVNDEDIDRKKNILSLKHNLFFFDFDPVIQTNNNEIRRRREEELDITLDEVLACMSLISFMKSLKFILKTTYPVRSEDDWRIKQGRTLLDFLNQYVAHSSKVFKDSWKLNSINKENIDKLKASLKSFLELTKFRLGKGVFSAPADSQSQDICESHFALARLVSGLKNSPTIVDYFYRIAHIFVRLQYKIKKSTYDFVETMNEEDDVRKTLLSRKLTTKLKNKEKELSKTVHDRIFRNSEQLKRQFQTSDRSRDYDDIEYERIKHKIGNAIKATRNELKSQKKKKILSFLLKERDDSEGRRIHIPKNWLCDHILVIHTNIIRNLSEMNIKLYPEILEYDLSVFAAKVRPDEYLETFRVKNKKSYKDQELTEVYRALIAKLVKYEVYERFVAEELTASRFKQSFRGERSNKTQ